MSRIRLLLMGLLAVGAVSAVASASASAHEYLIEQTPLKGSAEVEGVSKTSTLEGEVAKTKVFIVCSEDTLKGKLKEKGESSGTIEFKKCKLLNSKKEELTACKVTEPIKAKVNDKLIGPEKKEELEDEFTPEVGTEFTKIEITGGSCALTGKFEVTGSQKCKLPEAEKDKEEHVIECTKAGSKLELGKRPASFESKEEKVKLATKQKWGAV